MKTSLKLGLFTLLLFGGGGLLLIEYLQEKSIYQVFTEGKDLYIQILAGLITGLAASAIAVGVISMKFFDQEREFYHGLISKWSLDISGMVFLSICAGIGEELFFRAGIQPFFGIWWTSTLFVLLHGYLNPRNWRISVYGVVMVGIIAGFGYLFRHIGIFSAMAAHAVLDMVLFRYMTGIKSS